MQMTIGRNAFFSYATAALPLVLILLWALGEHSGWASTIWDGPLITFTEPAGGIGSNPADQDRLTSDVWLTRNVTQGLFNAAQETGYTHFSSPLDTEWAYGSLADYATLSYATWEAWNGHNPPSMVGQPAVLHLISDDIYLSIEFLSWPTSGGGFSYQRSTAVVPEPSAEALLLAGAGLASIRCYWRKLRLRRMSSAKKAIGEPGCR